MKKEEMSSALHGVTMDILPIAAITRPTWDEIWQLTHSIYDTKRDYTEENLKKRQRVVLFRTRTDRTLIGMASVDITPLEFQGRQLVSIYTAHVMIQPQYRGHNLLQKIGFLSFIEARLRFPLRPIYWFFSTFSYASYLLLPNNFSEYWPRFDRQIPVWERDLISQLAEQVYSTRWNADTGIVTRSGQKRLRTETTPANQKITKNPHVEFFVQATPDHVEGDALACLCPLSTANWLSVGINAFKRIRKSSARSRKLLPQSAP